MLKELQSMKKIDIIRYYFTFKLNPLYGLSSNLGHFSLVLQIKALENEYLPHFSHIVAMVLK
jgi:hypothetical protein